MSEEELGTVGDGDGYGDKRGQCGNCKKEIIIHTDWLANVYEESIAFYTCKYCKHAGWYYI